jgi:hypothetical protein
MNKKVNLLILGTQKAGTTSLYEYIRQHHDIYFSDVKEVTYFVEDKLYQKGEDYYHSFFTKVTNEKIIASAYVHMLSCKEAPLRVKQYNKDMKFIIMLREPVSRAYSAYNYAIKNGWENEKNSFEDTITLEPERIKNKQFDLMYFENGMYYKHIKRWQEYFPKENFLLIKDTDLRNDPKEVLKKVFQFLNIENDENIDTSKEFNKAGVVRSKILQSFLLKKDSTFKSMVGRLLSRNLRVWVRANVLKKIYQFNQIDQHYNELDENLKNKLSEYFRSDLKALKDQFEIEFK